MIVLTNFAVVNAKTQTMKRTFLITAFMGLSFLTFAQEQPPSPTQERSLPIVISIFSESVSLAQFRQTFKSPHIGFRIGTELYYNKKSPSRMYQTINVGYYHHKQLHNGFFLSSEFGYRKFFHHTFLDVSAGVGYLLVDSALPRYKKSGHDYQAISSTFGRIMPTLGIGLGHQFSHVAIFSRYELFGEMPFGFKGIPALPHQSLHLGTRFNFK